MSDVVAFLHDMAPADLPAEVAATAATLLLDLADVAAAGGTTAMARIARDHAARHMGAGTGPGARMLLDGRRVSPVGAAFAGAAVIDSFDAHDGHRLTKGHAGAAVLPALLAYADAEGLTDGAAFLAALVLGYEVATRAGMALHASARDYHTSGAWNGVACAGLGARLLGLDAQATRHALGIAEYHGPRSQMMRCIDHPTMVKDGSAMGAMTGVQAAYLAADGFTGAPAVTVEAPAHAGLWADLGSRWRILEQYVKPYPVCRWAQPAVEAALALQRAAGLAAEAIQAIRVETFAAATRLAARAPATTEEAQYSTPFPVAAALVHGRLGPDEIAGTGLADPVVRTLAACVELVEVPEFEARFPAERWARASFLVDGTWITGEPCVARGDPETPLGETELRRKFRSLAAPAIGSERAALVEASVAALAEPGGLADLLRDLLEPEAGGDTQEAAPGGATAAAS